MLVASGEELEMAFGDAKVDPNSLLHQLASIVVSGLELSLNCKRDPIDVCLRFLWEEDREDDSDWTRLPYIPVLALRDDGLAVWASNTDNVPIFVALLLNAVATDRIATTSTNAFVDFDVIMMCCLCLCLTVLLMLRRVPWSLLLLNENAIMSTLRKKWKFSEGKKAPGDSLLRFQEYLFGRVCEKIKIAINIFTTRRTSEQMFWRQKFFSEAPMGILDFDWINTMCVFSYLNHLESRYLR